MVILVGRGLCCSVKCTGRGSRRKRLGRTKKPRNDECASPSVKTERKDWLELAWPWRGPGFPAVNFGICWSELPAQGHLSDLSCPARSVGGGERPSGTRASCPLTRPPRPQPRHLSGQLFARSPASTLECALTTRTFFRFRVWALCEGGAVVCGVLNPSPMGQDFSFEFFKFEGVGSQIHNQVSPT